jgi:DNA-binding NarL/FixJ family response regulator
VAPQEDVERILFALAGAQTQYREFRAARKRLILDALKLGLTQVQIARTMGLSEGRVSQILRDKD